ncbi:MaoC family dehydratase N-terminal domain-containing protein [Actibacterium sp. MT2.3-13A]|uniref:FAS1-like dehydratase domain-containing protein n=1 Tax=Actibacterium sp. MT2.3-13A TaxID=2828332 RepID=UPI001BA80970|nr:MaoC family dehydratase N-terminal domain-containing protein [Actibacterium sp. MT2.3-13A]
MTEATQDLDRWIGRSETATDVLDPRPARMMASILPAGSALEEGDILPPLWHWLYFPTAVPLAGLGRDGHPARGGFLPPVALPRRMWAGGRFEFHGDLRLGEPVEKRSEITSIRSKQGKSGALCFVTVTHSLSVAGQLRLREEHDIVYRDDPAPDAPRPTPPAAPEGADLTEEITPSPVMLFRYSAVTFNGHRIHYDRDYCRDVEGYPGLVFHGPLTATLLADLAQRAAGRPLAAFGFRAVSPLFDTAPFTISVRRGPEGADLWATAPGGALAMTAEATFR